MRGEVVALGRRQRGSRFGDKVVAYQWIGCGECAGCANNGWELLVPNPGTS